MSMASPQSPREYWSLQGIERGLVASDRQFARKFAEFSGSKQGAVGRAIARAADFGHRRSIAGLRRRTLALFALLAAEVLCGVWMIVGNPWLVVGLAATGVLALSVGGALALTRRRSPRQVADGRPRTASAI